MKRISLLFVAFLLSCASVGLASPQEATIWTRGIVARHRTVANEH